MISTTPGKIDMANADGTLMERARRVFGPRVRENYTLGYFLDGRPINSIELVRRVLAIESVPTDIVIIEDDSDDESAE